TIDQWLLKNAKEDAIAELKKAGITEPHVISFINHAPYVSHVNGLKNAILKAHA
uniref:RFX-V1 n=1 Tax=synthetic construct TaxID=32630 RepID=UPI00194ADA9E